MTYFRWSSSANMFEVKISTTYHKRTAHNIFRINFSVPITFFPIYVTWNLYGQFILHSYCVTRNWEVCYRIRNRNFFLQFYMHVMCSKSLIYALQRVTLPIFYVEVLLYRNMYKFSVRSSITLYVGTYNVRVWYLQIFVSFLKRLFNQIQESWLCCWNNSFSSIINIYIIIYI